MNFRSLIIAGAVALSMTACNAGSTTSPVSSTPVTSVAQTVALTAGSPQTLSAVSGITPVFTPPNVTGASSISGTESSTAPTGIPALSIAGPVAQGARSAKSVPGGTDLLYFAFTPSANITTSGSFTLQFNLASAPASGTSYYIAAYDGSAWHTNALSEVGTLSSTKTSVSFTSSIPLTLSANTQYALALYAVSSGTSVSLGNSSTSISSLQFGANSASITIPAVTALTSVSLTSLTDVPSSLPSLGSTTTYGVLQVVPSSSTVVSAGGQVSFVATLATASTSNAPFHIAEYDTTTNTWLKGIGTASVSGTGVTISAALPNDFALSSSATYYFALYQ